MSRILATLPGRVRVVLQGEHTSLQVAVDDLRASTWLDAVLSAEEATWLNLLIRILSVEDGERLADMLASGDLPVKTLIEAAKDMLTTVAARPWWEAFNIIAVADASWDAIGGQMAAGGVQADLVTLGTWLDAAFYLMRKSTKDEKSHDQLVTEIKRKPIEDGDEGEMDEADFMAAMTELAGH